MPVVGGQSYQICAPQTCTCWSVANQRCYHELLAVAPLALVPGCSAATAAAMHRTEPNLLLRSAPKRLSTDRCLAVHCCQGG
jgi:hypothetical protein